MSGLGRYTLVRKVGTGGMAEVWKAKAKGPAGFEKTVAIKKVLKHLAEDAEFLQMIATEARLSADLDHSNIVRVFDFGEVGDDGGYFIAMEYIAGLDLASVFAKLTAKAKR